MNEQPLKRRRVLGIVHFVAGVASFVPAGYAGLWIAPLVLGPLWFCVLGVWLWRPTPRLMTALVVTHSVVAFFAGLNIAFGIYALKAADESARKGGGLMGGIGLLPIAWGAALLILAGFSFWAAYAMRSESKKEVHPAPNVTLAP